MKTVILDTETTGTDVEDRICQLAFLVLLLIHFVVGETIYSSTLTGLALILGGLAVQKSRRH
ncbi:hypothetical protein [Nitratifractor sp.]